MEFIKKNRSNIIYGILLAFFGLYLLYSSQLSPGTSGNPSVDSSVFSYIAESMKEGKIPYKDLFDHKGMLLYIIDFIGIVLFNGRIGIWILEIIAMYVNFFLVWKIVKLFSDNKMIAFFTTIIAFLPFPMFYQGGNLTEEWALPCILTILYLCLKYLKDRQKESVITPWVWILNGITTGAILWLRPNMIVVTIVFIGAIGIDLLIKKQFKNIFKCILWFCIGLGIISLPIVIYLLANGALKDCINSYILFNFSYVGDKGESGLLQNAIQFFSQTVLAAISLISCIIGMSKTDKKSNQFLIFLTSAIFIVFSYILISISGRTYPHYAIICIPTYVYPIAYALDYILQNKKQSLVTAITLTIGMLLVFSNEINTGINVSVKEHNRNKNSYQNLKEYISENTNKDDEVIVDGNKVAIYLAIDRKNSAKYFYQTPIADIDENIAEQFLEWLENTKPKIIINTLGKPSNNSGSYFRKSLFKYYDDIVKSGEYVENKNVMKNIIIYERAN